MARKLSSWIEDYATNAHLDYIKLRIQSCRHPRKTVFIREIQSAYETWTRLHPGDYHLPKVTVLDPSPAKPDGMTLVELFGPVAQCVRYLPTTYLYNVTYAHVKTYVKRLEMAEMARIAIELQGWRQPSVRRYKKGRGNKESGIVVAFGSGKSGLHLSVYRRGGQPVGMEGKFRDEFVKVPASDAFEDDTGDANKRIASWDNFVKSLGYKAARGYETEFHLRGIDPLTFCPVSVGGEL